MLILYPSLIRKPFPGHAFSSLSAFRCDVPAKPQPLYCFSVLMFHVTDGVAQSVDRAALMGDRSFASLSSDRLITFASS